MVSCRDLRKISLEHIMVPLLGATAVVFYLEQEGVRGKPRLEIRLG
jgi:hypothetical protein